MQTKTIFSCQKCGAQTPKWAGRCSECGGWGTLSEEMRDRDRDRDRDSVLARPGKTISLDQLHPTRYPLHPTGLDEVDRVLGGGIPAGAVILLAGEPGIGKSTLVAQIASVIARSPDQVETTKQSHYNEIATSRLESGLAMTNKNDNSVTVPVSVLYISGEESPEQLKGRFDRLSSPSPHPSHQGRGINSLSSPSMGEDKGEGGISVLTDTNAETVAATIEAERPALAIVDSIQTMTADVAEKAGAITQLKASTAILNDVAKRTNVPVLLIGQVTKSLDIAGPKSLEHLVDIVLTFEGDRYGQYRILRAAKNRFGSTDEIGVFEMTDSGLREVKNPSAAFLETRSTSPGSVVTCVLEGSRPILVEVQALATKTHFPYPERRTSGFDLNRLNLLLAVLSKSPKSYNLNPTTNDIHVNITSGFKIKEPAADLAVLLAIASSLTNKPLPQNLVAFGEVGLGGELRPVREPARRLNEAKKLNFGLWITPAECKTLAQAFERAGLS